MMQDTDEIDDLEAERRRMEALDAFHELEESARTGGVVAIMLLEAKKESDGAMIDLVKTDPFDGPTIRELQWKVSRYHDLVNWIAVIRDNAASAQEDLSDEDRAMAWAIIRGETVKDA